MANGNKANNSSYKTLYRSRTNKIVAGVLGGLGEYLNMDPTVLRLIFIMTFIFTGFIPMTLLYLIAAMVMPEQPVL